MYEELTRDLRNWSEAFGKDPNPWGPVPIKRLRAAADAIEELSREIDIDNAAMTAMDAAIPRWIPVTERLPEEEEVVLVWGGASVYTAKRHNKYGGLMWWKLNSKQHYCNPTHWMPLPEPPEEET